MTLIYIENQLLDAPSIPALLTLQLDDVKDFAIRNTTFSKTIVFPGTANNNKIFGHYFETKISNPNNPSLANVKTNFNAAKSARCIILQDNIQSFKGVIRLLEVVIDGEFVEYECGVFGELGGLISSMGSKKLTDLDFSEYDHVFSIPNVTGSWANMPSATGVVYPLIDYGTYGLNSKHDWKIGTFRPALKPVEYLDKIITGLGYTYTFDLKDTDRFKRLIIPHNRKVLTATNTLQLNRTGTSQVINDGSSLYVRFDAGTNGAFNNAADEIFEYKNTNPPNVINITATIQVNLFNGNIPGFTLFVDGVNVGKIYPDNFGLWEVTATNIGIAPLDTVYFIADSLVSGNDVTFTSTIVITAATAIPTNIEIGDTVKLNDCIPQNVLQKDFFSSLIRLFNLYVYEDPNKFKHVNIEPFIDFFLPVSGAVNWDDKIDRSKPRRIKPMSELNARYYNFKFKQDSDYYNELYSKRYGEGYGDRIFDSEFEFASETFDANVIFSGTPLIGYTGEDKVYSTIFKQSNNVEENVDSNIRILQCLNVTGVASWNIRNSTDSATLATLTNYPYAGHLNDPDAPTNDIQFGVPKELFFSLATGNLSANQFNVYWSPYMAEITDKDSKLMKCTARLKITDILNLDFAKYVWVDGSLWRLNKITDYDTSEDNTCEIELLKVIFTTY